MDKRRLKRQGPYVAVAATQDQLDKALLEMAERFGSHIYQGLTPVVDTRAPAELVFFLYQADYEEAARTGDWPLPETTHNIIAFDAQERETLSDGEMLERAVHADLAAVLEET